MYEPHHDRLGLLGFGRIFAAIVLLMLLLPWLVDVMAAGELVPLEGQHLFALTVLAVLGGLKLWEARVTAQVRRLQCGRDGG